MGPVVAVDGSYEAKLEENPGISALPNSTEDTWHGTVSARRHEQTLTVPPTGRSHRLVLLRSGMTLSERLRISLPPSRIQPPSFGMTILFRSTIMPGKRPLVEKVDKASPTSLYWQKKRFPCYERPCWADLVSHCRRSSF